MIFSDLIRTYHCFFISQRIFLHPLPPPELFGLAGTGKIVPHSKSRPVRPSFFTLKICICNFCKCTVPKSVISDSIDISLKDLTNALKVFLQSYGRHFKFVYYLPYKALF